MTYVRLSFYPAYPVESRLGSNITLTSATTSPPVPAVIRALDRRSFGTNRGPDEKVYSPVDIVDLSDETWRPRDRREKSIR